MKKTLYLLRHAKSSWKDITLNDFDRPLNKRGKYDAPFMAEKMKSKSINPQIIISSPAKRAKKTAKIFSLALQCTLHFDKRLYGAEIDEMITIIQEAFETYDEVMVVGHNPELTILNDLLSNSEIFNIPTSGIVSIVFKNSKLQEKQGKQLFFDYPKKYRENQ